VRESQATEKLDVKQRDRKWRTRSFGDNGSTLDSELRNFGKMPESFQWNNAQLPGENWHGADWNAFEDIRRNILDV
jgi:hypothetical protein